MKTIVLSLAAAKQLFDLPLRAQDAVEASLERYAMTGLGDVKALSGQSLFPTARRALSGHLRRRPNHRAGDIGKRETTTYRRGR